MFTLEQYKQYYRDEGRCVDQAHTPKNTLNDRVLESKYKKYVKKENKKRDKKPKKDIEWEQAREEVFKRDKGECQLLKKLDYSSIRKLKENSGGLHNIIDPAHIFNKATYRELYYEPENIICLNRFSHSMLDFNKHPITGIAISREEVDYWWVIIVGIDRINKLLKKMEEI